MTSPYVVSLPTHPTRCVDERALHLLAAILQTDSIAPAVVRRAARVGVHATHFGERAYGCETSMQAWRRLRTDVDVLAVLDEVRRSGHTARGTVAYPISDPVEVVAHRSKYWLRHAGALQRKVDVYAATLDAAWKSS